MTSHPNEDLAARLRLLQGKKSLRVFAILIDEPPSSVSVWVKKRGSVVPGLFTLIKIADRCQAERLWVLTGEGPEFKDESKTA